MSYSSIFGGGGGGGALGVEAYPILASKTLPAFTRAGKVQIALVGATGSHGFWAAGGFGVTASNSAPWGVRVIDVAIGDVLQFVIAAGGAAPTTDGPGIAASNCVVNLNGTPILTAEPGEAGKRASTFPLTNPATATVTGADWWVKGVAAKTVTAGGPSYVYGGPAVDVYRTGLGTVAGAAGGSVGSAGLDGQSPAVPFPSIVPELGLLVIGAKIGGIAGYGGSAVSGEIADGGMFAGSAGVSSGARPKPGRGAGAGVWSGTSPGSPGGDGYAYLIFVPDAE